MSAVTIGNRRIGDGEPCFIVAEIGINHNGDVDLASKLIDAARWRRAATRSSSRSGRSTSSTRPKSSRRPRESPFGTTNGDLKRGLEFGEEEYRADRRLLPDARHRLVRLLLGRGVGRLHRAVRPACYKIASASLTDDALLRHHRATGRPLILSTGMSTLDEIDHAVEVLGTEDLILLHATSTYPSALEELNLRTIQTLRERYGVPVGLLGPRGRSRRPRRGRGPGRVHDRAPHHPRSRDVGKRPGCVRRAARHRGWSATSARSRRRWATG